MINDTTRKHPRTLDQAYPFGASYGCPVEHYRRPVNRWYDYMLAVIIGLVLAALLFFWLSY
jgi:hypothetical protein